MKMTALSVYLIGVVVLILGVGYAAHLAGLPDKWLAALSIVLIGAGIISAVVKTRTKDPPAAA
jgi:hypothetical protein